MAAAEWLTKCEEQKQKIDQLTKDIGNREQQTWVVSSGSVILSALLSLGVAGTGLVGLPQLAPFLGLITALLIGLENAFAFGEKHAFYAAVRAEGENLLTTLEAEVRTEAEFLQVVEKFKSLRKFGDEKVPRGQGMNAIKDLGKELGK